MAREFVEVGYSDLSGVQAEDVYAVKFSLDGKAYEIDLTLGEREELDGALRVYLERARRAPSGQGATATRPSGRRSRKEVVAARLWLKLRGRDVSDRGRIKAEYWAEWENAGKPGLG